MNYRPIVEQIKKRYGIRIRHWRKSMTGAAWRVSYSDGRRFNWIECPRPKSPLSLAIFLHEVGHHVIGFERYQMGCEEELYAWRWAIETMKRLLIQPDARTQRRFCRSMQYAVSKAIRHGLTQLPDALKEFREVA